MTSGPASPPDARSRDAATPAVWALLGRRTGDNRQILALAAAIGLPWAAKPLAFNAIEALPNLSHNGWLDSLTPAARAALAPPWPDVVLAAGKRSAPAALWVKAASGGRTRLVHIGRPWAPLAWFDLVITTPQYGLPARPDVITNRLPLTAEPEADPDAADDDLAALPRPRLVVLAGGDSPPLVFDADAARALAAAALERTAQAGGALLVATSPRTPAGAVAALREALVGAAVPVRLSIFGDGANRYRAFLAAADACLVTDDSASMVTEAALTAAPVALFPLPRRPNLKRRLMTAVAAASAKTRVTAWAFGTLVERGAVTSIRDLRRFMAGLEEARLLDGGDAARRCAAEELAAAAARVRALWSEGST